jgi:hypothetical protein
MLSSKSYIDLVSKDFAKNYINSVTVYQNDLGYLDKFQKSIGALKNDYRVFIQYNELVAAEENKVTLKNVLQPVPITFKTGANTTRLLQRAFNLLKYLVLQRIYKNNYTKHCINKVYLVEEKSESENESKINMCIILLEHSNDLNTNTMNGIFYQNLLNNFKRHADQLEAPKKEKKNAEEYTINVNYGIASLEENKKLNKLYNDYMTEKNITAPKEKSKLILVINDTQEKFVFKWFKEEESMKEYFEDFEKSDFFEDSQFSVRIFFCIFYLYF